jgi:hypothetical protein
MEGWGRAVVLLIKAHSRIDKEGLKVGVQLEIVSLSSIPVDHHHIIKQ